MKPWETELAELAKAANFGEPWVLQQWGTELRIGPKPPFADSLVICAAIGSTPLAFRSRRNGAHRGGKVRYDNLTEEDIARAALIVHLRNKAEVMGELVRAARVAVWQDACDGRHEALAAALAPFGVEEAGL